MAGSWTHHRGGNWSARLQDGGWAWIVLLAAHLTLVMSSGYLTSLGMFYIEWKEYFDVSATSSSWLVSMPFIVACPMCVVSGAIASRFGVRRVSMIGATVNALATVIGSFATDMNQLYACGVLSGAGSGLMIPPCLIMVSKYFNKRYSLAIGLTVLGVNSGQFIFPPIIRLLTIAYGWRGAMLVIGAIQMNGIAVCAIFRPLPGEYRPIQDSKPHRKSSPCVELLSVLTNVPVMLVFGTCAFHSAAWMLVVGHLPARSKEAGWSRDHGAMLLLIFSVTSMITRSVHGWFVDSYIDRFTLQLIISAIATVVTALNPVSDSYIFLALWTALIGLILGMPSPLLIANMKVLASETEYPIAISLIYGNIFLFNALGEVFAGYLFDLTGNYVATFLGGSAMFGVSAIIFVFVIIIKVRKDNCTNS